MLESEFKFYVSHQQELLQKYKGKYVVIVGEKVVGDFSKITEALQFSAKEFEPGTFLIQKCEGGQENYTQVFHSYKIAF